MSNFNSFGENKECLNNYYLHTDVDKFPTKENCPYTWENTIWNEYKIVQRRFKIDWDWKFFAILPALNINIHSLDIEFEWLFLGVYWNFWKKKEQIYTNVKPEGFECYWKKPRKIGEI